jgi:hypothetical protein
MGFGKLRQGIQGRGADYECGLLSVDAPCLFRKKSLEGIQKIAFEIEILMRTD